MALVVVGGHSRNIGKTGVMAGVIAAFAGMWWTAIKIEQLGRGASGDHEIAGQAIEISEELDAVSEKDTSRYLAAGATRSYLVRTQRDLFAEAMPRVLQLIESADNVIVESNSLLGFVEPELALFVADERVADFKLSALASLDRVDAVVMVGDAACAELMWQGVGPSLLAGKPRFFVDARTFTSVALQEFVREALETA